MKKVFVVLIVVLLVCGGYWFFKNRNKAPENSTVRQYDNPSLGISFSYPKILTAGAADNTITLHHDVAFVHRDYCDFKGEGTTTLPRLTDFNITIHTDDTNLVDTIKTESPYIPSQNFVNGNVVPSPGFIDPVAIGSFSGYKISESVEGCGQTVYFFPVGHSRTLVVTDDITTVFTGVIDPSQSAKALTVSGIISNEQNRQIFEQILKSVKI